MTNESDIKQPRTGKVYLVGAGPGHPELLTLKAARLLQEADVIVYDRLIQEEVLALGKPSAERIYMGKPVGKHDSRQDEIHQTLVSKAREGKKVVRLKGGDPFVFGRGGEEAEYLADHGVPFEVIPGVSSALAAPLSAGIAVTHRDMASAVSIVTGHECSRPNSTLDWSALSRMETLVFLMGVSNTAIIAQKLIEHGRSLQTPAAMIQMAFWHGESVVTGTLATIADDVAKAKITPPATLVVGEVVRLREKLQQSERDLARRPDGTERFNPGPGPDQVMRIATAGLGSQVLRLALAMGLFDCLEEFHTPAELAVAFGLNTAALDEILTALVALGLLESAPEGYRNLELASRYLTSSSPQSLKPALLYLSSYSGFWEALAKYALNGSRDLDLNGSEKHYREACESLARFAAPAVAEKLDLAGGGPVLLVGWGAEAYRDALARRWPKVAFRASNPFVGDTSEEAGCFGTVLLSGLLSSSKRGEIQQSLQEAYAALQPSGTLAFHDAFLPDGVLPAPEVILGALGRHMTRGGCRNWSVDRVEAVLGEIGFTELRSQALPAGTVLITGTKPA